MASKINTMEPSLSFSQEKEQTTSGLRFDWLMVIVGIWWLGGLFIDGWAHSNIPQLETFFTPWHAILYSGYLAVAITLIVKVWQNLRGMAASTSPATPMRSFLQGNRWMRAIPTGYELSLLGVVIFGISGVGDLTWHLIFGIERSTEALLSPTHLGLALGLGLALSGPLRAAWRRVGVVPSLRSLGPAILSLTFTFSLLTFFTEYASPLINIAPLSDARNAPTEGITDILFLTATMMSFMLLALRRWRLPFGTFTFLLGINGTLMAVFLPVAIIVSLPTALLGGIAADLLYRNLQPSLDQVGSVRLFAFLVPVILFAFYFIDLNIIGPAIFNTTITWTVPFWTGAPIIAGIAGFLLSYVMFPPLQSVEDKDETLV